MNNQTSMTKEEIKKIANRLQTSMKIQNKIYLAGKKNPPTVYIYEDSNCFFSPNENLIHMGAYAPVNIFKVSTKEDYVAALEYLFGHENQHVRSTATIPYNNGIKLAAKAIVEEIAKIEKINKRFRNDNDYDVFLQKDLATRNIHVKMDTMLSICSFLMNSVEDGRIERIRASEFPEYERQRRYFRSIFWDTQFVKTKYQSGKMSPSDRLDVHMANILSLATTGLYYKGFVSEFGTTELMDEVRQMMPEIAKGVLSKKTREMAEHVVNLARILAPYIYEASKMTEAEQALRKMLEDLMKRLINDNSSGMANTSEAEEMQGDSLPNSVFEKSDLVLIVDDETYDKMMENAKNSENHKGMGVMIQREHPKPDENNSPEEQKNNGSDDHKQPDEKKDAQQNQNSSSNSSNPNDNQMNDSDSEADSSDSAQDAGSESNSENMSQSDTNANSKPTNNNMDSTSQKSSGRNDSYTEEEMQAEREKAAIECRADSKEKVANINQISEHSSCNNRGFAPIVDDKDDVIDPKSVKDVCDSFIETKRIYKLDTQLPVELNCRAKTFRKKNERYFRGLKSPTVCNLDSGNIDPSRLHGLAMGEIDVFRKKGIEKTFDGCVYMLIDNSGSMSGKKKEEACKAAAVIEEGFKSLIPLKIVGFDATNKIVHEVIKGWDESQRLNCCWNFAKHSRNGCGNEDNYDILIAQKELLARQEQKKLLIVLSDGAPSDTKATKLAIEQTRKKGIQVFGIYFENGPVNTHDANQFKSMYQKDFVCCPLNEVDSVLTKLMIKFSRS